MSARRQASARRSCAVTGANGYVGSVVARRFRKDGWRVREMRHDGGFSGADDREWNSFSLERGAREEDLHGIETLIHCAYDFTPIRWSDIARINVDGSTRLFEAARAAGVSRIIHVSTMSAFEGCASLYGKAKLAIEEAAARAGAVCVRPGLVYGDEPGGTMGALETLVSTSPVIPLVGTGRYVQYLAHQEDLCDAILELSERQEDLPREPILAAAEQPRSLREILESLAVRQGKKVSFVPVPESLILAALKGAEALGLRPGFRSDSLISLVHPNPNPNFGPTRGIEASFRPFDLET